MICPIQEDMRRQKLNEIISEVMAEISPRCSCTFNIDSETFSCRGAQGNFEDTVVFRARVTVQASSSVITADDVVSNISSWVESSPSIAIVSVTVFVDPNCPAMLDSFNSADCVIVTPSTSSSPPVGVIVGAAIGAVIVIIIIIIVVVLVVVYYTRKCNKR